MKKVQGNIKANDKMLGLKDSSDSKPTKNPHSPRINLNDTNSTNLQIKHTKETINLELLDQRRAMSEMELQERQYCALRIAEYLENNGLWPKNTEE